MKVQDGGSVGPSRETAPPGLTVVVIVLGGWNYLVRCLSALHQQSGVPTPEIIVPYDERLGETPALHAQFSHVHFLHVEGRRTYAELRAVGVQKDLITLVPGKLKQLMESELLDINIFSVPTSHLPMMVESSVV